MGAELSFLMLRLCVFLSFFQILGSAGHVKDDAFSTAETPGFGYSVAAPPQSSLSSLSPIGHSSLEKAPVMYDTRRSKHASPAPSVLPFQHMAKSWTNSKSSTPEDSYFKHHHHHHYNHHLDHRHQARPQNSKPAAGLLNMHTPISNAQHATEPAHEVSPLQPPYSSPTIQNSPVVASSPSVVRMPIHPPLMSPSSTTMELTPPPTLAWALPPPPPNQDCATVTCTEPWTYTPSGFPCGCVWPIQVKLLLNVSLYTFFPLVSELAVEIASSLSLNQSQVRIIGANAARQQPEKTTVLINLVPVEEKYTYTAAFSAYEKFWRKQIHVNYSLFGAYDVLGVHYPGLPPSPPSLSSNLAAIDNHPHPASHKDNGGSSLKPLGVAIPRRQKNGSSGRLAAVIIISCITALVTCAAIVWMLIASCRCSSACQHEEALHTSTSSYRKPSGARSLALGSRSLSESLSFSSGMVYVTGYAKIYSLLDIERATGAFDSTRVLGEGGFGVVYKGTFDNGEEVAVKVLKRDTRHGAREFLSEVEMLSRLHHRNLVKLLGICTEDHIRCLVYELVPNGSVESHLHGADKDAGPLDWPTRMTIALGAARGLAYLHEDSSPCVIHRDFKSSNILLEHDFTPKVSDFGLATTALNGGTEPISTQVIGTFGYLAPEYAMTGHLLVKSDVYSYGVVLLELLTGRKPVDFSKPPGQENLVSWALPLLTSNEGLEMIMDTSLRPIFPFDSFTKVAAIALMCVQPEVSRRPFMGEVVQALKLVCSELDSANEEVPRNSSSNQEKFSVGEDSKSGKISGDFQEFLGTHYPVLGYDSSSDAKIASSAVDLMGASARFEDIEIESSRRKCSSGPLGLGRKRPFWQRFGSFYRGSMRERLWPGTH